MIMYSDFMVIVKPWHACLATSRTLLQWLLACLNFTLDSDYVGTNEKKDFDEPCQLHKHGLSEAWPDTYN